MVGMDVDALWDEIELIYRARLPHFERVARAVTGNRESAMEAVQEGFADALRNADRYAAAGPLEGWVWRCVVNRAIKSRTPPTAPDVDVGVADGHDGSNHADVRTRVAALPERQRLVVFLRYYADLGYREIAAALDIEVGTVSATLSAAHASLRASILEAHL
jgi:RNA polymerase sigma-70 factor (ECF subfamily)